MNEWKEMTLGEICSKIGSGSTPKGGQNAYKSVGISLIRSQNVLDFSFSRDGLAFIDDEQANKLKNVTIEEKDILINITGDSVARVCRVPDNVLPARINQHVSIIRCLPEQAENDFVLYFLQYEKEKLLNLASAGATRNALTKEMLEKYPITLPPLPEQKAIAETLSCLDEKIELNNKINRNLEEQAQAIFDEYFPDLEKNCIDLGSVVKTTSGGTPSRKNKEYYVETGIPWVKSKELNGLFVTSTEEYITDEAVQKSSAKLLTKHSVLIAMYGATVGEYCVISSEMTCNQAICSLVPNEDYPFTFLFMFVKNRKDFLKNSAVGSAQQNISQLLIKELLIPKDTVKIAEFHSLTEPLFSLMEKNLYENQTLIEIRNTLLPKLMSGEVRVPLEN